jgi:hypothetical protein
MLFLDRAVPPCIRKGLRADGARFAWAMLNAKKRETAQKTPTRIAVVNPGLQSLLDDFT